MLLRPKTIGLTGNRHLSNDPSISAIPFVFFSILFSLFFFFFFILRRMGKNKALAHHTSAYFHTRRVSI